MGPRPSRDYAQASEPELLQLAKRGDREAFGELTRRSFADTYTLAFRLTGNDQDARDVCQEAYIRAFRAIGRFRGDAQFSTWMYRITANCASTLMAKKARRRTEVLEEQTEIADLRSDSDPQARADNSATRTVLDDMVARLPATMRAVVLLRDVYDLPHDQIARQLGISETAAKVRLHRARRKLRDQIEASGNHDLLREVRRDDEQADPRPH